MAGAASRRSFNHGSPFKYVNFRVRIPNQEGNVVCLVGSGDELGNWDPRGAKVMHLDADNNIWCCNVMLPSPEVFRYRYFVCRPLWHEVKDRCSKVDVLKDASGISVLFWESNIVCRLIQTRILPEQFDMPIVDFSVRYHHYSEWTRGWLFDTEEIRLRIAGKSPIEITSLPAGKNILLGIRCTPKNFKAMSQLRTLPPVLSRESGVRYGRLANATTLPISSFYTGICGPGDFNNLICKDNESPFCGDIFMSKLDGVKCIPALQEAGGILCCPNEFITFNVNTCNAAALGFRFEIYDVSHVKSKLIGYTYILPVGKWRSRQKVLIYCKNGKEIGHLTVDTLYFTPITSLAMDMKISYQNHWKMENRHRRSTEGTDYVLGPNFP
ncbi:unnamed protein product [Lymnaea stagnalis]|uniref:CBM20 domain-containing protein n=1 Tax=Lymnaea stagnalis TaxID=6523 RepID=A0AAV2H7U5_LYMST